MPVAAASEPAAKWKASPIVPPLSVAQPVGDISLAAGPSPVRARAQRRFPVLLVVVLALVALLPIVALVAALAMTSSEPATVAVDDQIPTNTTDEPSPRPQVGGEVRDNDKPSTFPKPGEGVPRATPVASGGPDRRDPFDNSPSFGRTSDAPKLEQTVTVSAKTLLPRIAFFSLPAEARTPIELKAGQIVKLKIDGEWRIAATEPRGVDALYIAVGHAGQPATQFAQGAGEVEFNVQKDGWLFMGIEDLLNFDNTGAMNVQVSVY
jgi:hypothetical protein